MAIHFRGNICSRTLGNWYKLEDSDQTKFIVSLKEPVRLDLISPKDAQDLIRAVESGQIAIKEAIKMVEDVVKAAKP
jgi:hypothetical protein